MRLYMKFFALHLKRAMAYRRSFWFGTIGQFIMSFTAWLGMRFLLGRFGDVKGYTLAECTLCGGIVLTAFSLAECFFRGFDHFDTLVRQARLDRLLLRPRGVLFQVLCEEMEFDRAGRLLQGGVMLAWGVSAAGIAWTPLRAAALLLMVICGAVVFGGLYVVQAALCFVTLEGLEAMNVFTYGAREYGVYPVDVYGRGALRFCTFLIPYALFQYWPLQYLLGRSGDARLAFVPLLAAWFLAPCALAWRAGLRKYASAGS